MARLKVTHDRVYLDSVARRLIEAGHNSAFIRDRCEPHRYIAQGADKTVLDLGDGTVLKVQTKDRDAKRSRSFPRGQVRPEIELFLSLKPWERRYFAAILDYDDEQYTWAVQPYCAFVNPSKEADAFMDMIARKFNLCDVTEQNLGLYKGRIVAVDYGI